MEKLTLSVREMSLYEFVNPYFCQESAAEGEEDGKKQDVLIIYIIFIP
jgi:hypothetical protein